MVKGRKIVLGVCGSIAAYKACELVRRLKERGAAVRVVMTPTAASFVSPLTLSVLSGGPVLSSMGDAGLWHMAHLEVADWADVVLVAPATADFMARLAGGRSELLLDSLILSTKAKVVLCPAMDAQMWEHPATQANVEKMKTYGYEVWAQVHGALASGKKGMGRLIDQADILDRLEVLTASNGTRKAKSRA